MSLPYSESSEVAVLAAALTDERLQGDILEDLRHEDLYVERHRVIFAAMQQMFATGRNIDPVTISDQLESAGTINRAGGWEYIAELVGSNYSPSSVGDYIEAIANRATQRRLILACRDILDNATKVEPSELAGLIDSAEQSIYDAVAKDQKGGLVAAKDLVMPTLEIIEARSKEKISGVRTGLPTFDNMLTGFKPGQFILIAARPGMGKSAFRNCAIKTHSMVDNVPALVFSLEMDKEEEIERLLVQHSGVNGQLMRLGKLAPSDYKKIAASSAAISRAPIFIDDSAGVTPGYVRSKCRRFVREYGECVIYIDYIQLMSSGKDSSREQELEYISRSLKNLSRELRVPVVAMAQLNRGLESREDKRPRLSDLRGSGSLEQDADVVAFLYREEVYTGKHEGDAEIIVAKQRNGPIGTILCQYHKSTMTFYE